MAPQDQNEGNEFQDKDFKKIAKYFVIGIVLIIVLPFILTRSAVYDIFDYSKTGGIGDTLGGIMGPFIAILASALTFLAFWVQYKFNQTQSRQFKIQNSQLAEQSRLLEKQSKQLEQQSTQISVERFESKFFELLRIHRENVELLNIHGVYLREKAFEQLFREFRFCWAKVNEQADIILKKGSPEADLYNDEYHLVNISYLMYFYGIENIELVAESLKQEQYKFSFFAPIISGLKRDVLDRQDYIICLGFEMENMREYFKGQYKPFQGHHSILGRYYRHLFGTIRFIARQEDTVLNEAEKCRYASILRAQLTAHEQLLLYYNALSSIGQEWNAPENEFIERFRLIKNLPLPLADIGPLPTEVYEKAIELWKNRGKSFFEWYKHSQTEY